MIPIINDEVVAGRRAGGRPACHPEGHQLNSTIQYLTTADRDATRYRWQH